MHYFDTLRKVGLSTLKTRRLCGDLIEVFKTSKRFEHVAITIYFESSKSELRGHSSKEEVDLIADIKIFLKG